MHYAEAHYNQGNVLQKLGKHKKAILSFQKAIEFNSNYIKAHNNLGKLSS